MDDVDDMGIFGENDDDNQEVEDVPPEPVDEKIEEESTEEEESESEPEPVEVPEPAPLDDDVTDEDIDSLFGPA